MFDALGDDVAADNAAEDVDHDDPDLRPDPAAGSGRGGHRVLPPRQTQGRVEDKADACSRCQAPFRTARAGSDLRQ